MATKLYIGRGTGIFYTEKGGQFKVIQGDVYILDEAFAKKHAGMFFSADEYVAFMETRPAVPSPLAARRTVEQATAAPGEKRAVRKPVAKKPAAKKPAAKK